MRKIRIAQIGMNKNSHGIQVFSTLKSFPDIFDIAGYVLVENEREECARRLHIFEGYREMSLEEILEDETIEAVTVETDEPDLLKYALLAAEHGKHIHMEKPGSPSLPDFKKLVQIMKDKELVFHLGYMYRYNPMIANLLERVKRDELGDIYSVEAQMNCRLKDAAREYLSELPGGMTFYLGCHLIDLVLQIQGQPLNIIPFNKSSLTDLSAPKDNCMVIFEYPTGTSFIKTTAIEWGGFRRRQLVISGSKGTVELKPLETVACEGTDLLYTDERSYGTNDTWHTQGEFRRSDTFDRYESMLNAFAKMVRGEIKNPYTYEYELTLFETLMRCVDR